MASGTGFGLVAGAVGIGQWVLTQRDLIARWAAFQALYRQAPPWVYRDGTNLVRGNEWFWLGTSFVPAAVLLAMSWLAAFTEGWATQQAHDGWRAGFMAAVVGVGLYIAATIVAIATSPHPEMTETIMPCELVWGPVLFFGVFFLVRSGGDLGERAHRARSRSRTMP